MSFIRIIPTNFEIKRGSNKKIIEIIGSEISDRKALFQMFSEQLSFPDYFGENFDALNDFLLDLQWLKENTIEIYISEINELLNLENIEQKASLFFLLNDVCKTWKEDVLQDDEWDIKIMKIFVIGDLSSQSLIWNWIELGKDSIYEEE